MKFKSIQGGVLVLWSMAILMGSPLLASETVAIRSSDYLLGQEGVLAGSVFNRSGLPVSGLPVQILHDDQVVATAVSDENGEFAVHGLRNGQHSVRLGASRQPVRFWSKSAAPPATQARMALVIDEEIVRGQISEGLGIGTVAGIGIFSAILTATIYTTVVEDRSPASP